MINESIPRTPKNILKNIIEWITLRRPLEIHNDALKKIEEAKQSMPVIYPPYKYIPKRGIKNRCRRWYEKRIYWKYLSNTKKPKKDPNKEFYKELQEKIKKGEIQHPGAYL